MSEHILLENEKKSGKIGQRKLFLNTNKIKQVNALIEIDFQNTLTQVLEYDNYDGNTCKLTKEYRIFAYFHS